VLWKLLLSRHRAHGLSCCGLDPVASGPFSEIDDVRREQS
jgi:hypothetical protein